MAGFTLTLKMKDLFFDRAAVIDRIGKARARNLSKAGAFVQKRARTSLRRRKRASAPGQPPSVHSKDKFATLKNILFAYDPAGDSVIVGPVGFRAAGTGIGPARAPGDVPEALEHGGTLAIREVFVRGKWRLSTVRPRLGLRERTRPAVYAPRPFMGPALVAEQDAIAALWKDSV